MIVIKIGGSLLFDDNGNILADKIKSYCKIIKEAKNVCAIVCGGGIIARKYINASKIINMSESYKDFLGILVSRLNCFLFIAALGDIAYPKPAENIQDVLLSNAMNKIILAGGFIPAQSTTTVALEIAEILNSRDIIILTDVDGIYNKNPKEFTDALKYDKISIDELEKIIIKNSNDLQSAAGEYRIFDALSIQIFKRNNLNIRIINGNNPNNLKDVLSKGLLNTKIGTLIEK